MDDLERGLRFPLYEPDQLCMSASASSHVLHGESALPLQYVGLPRLSQLFARTQIIGEGGGQHLETFVVS